MSTSTINILYKWPSLVFFLPSLGYVALPQWNVSHLHLHPISHAAIFTTSCAVLLFLLLFFIHLVNTSYTSWQRLPLTDSTFELAASTGSARRSALVPLVCSRPLSARIPLTSMQATSILALTSSLVKRWPSNLSRSRPSTPSSSTSPRSTRLSRVVSVSPS